MEDIYKYMHYPDCKDRRSIKMLSLPAYHRFRQSCDDFFVESIDKGFELRFDCSDSHCIKIYLVKGNLLPFQFSEVADDLIKFLTINTDEYLISKTIAFQISEKVDDYLRTGLLPSTRYRHKQIVHYSLYDLLFDKVGDDDLQSIKIELL